MEFAVVAIVLLLAMWPLLSWLVRSRGRGRLGVLSLLGVGMAFACLALVAPRSTPELEIDHRPIQVPQRGDVSSSACRSCHPDQYASWEASYHSTMTQLPSPQSIRAPWDLRLAASWNDVTRTYFLERRGDEFWVRSEDDVFASPRGLEPGERRIELVTGSHHQQFYWYSTGDERRLAQLPIGYSIREDRWAPIHALLLSPGGAPHDLSGGWNAVCVGCHSTHGTPGMESSEVLSNFEGVAMDTRATEFGIACEACHGGAVAHVERQQNPLRRYASHFGDSVDDTIVNPARLDSKRATEVCGSCHSVNAFGRGGFEDLREFNRVGHTFRPGDVLADSRTIITLGWRESAATGRLLETGRREGEAVDRMLENDPDFFTNHFWSDGMVSINGRELNGLLESACYTRGELSCLSCHTLHQTREDPRPVEEWRDDQLDASSLGNAACLECHAGYREGANEHTKHAAGSPGSLCYNCHMPNTTYGLLKQTRSHVIDSPDVATTLQTGRPDACSLCHLDRPLAWSAQQLEQLYGKKPPRLTDLDHHFISYAALRALRGDAGSRAIVAWHMGWRPALEASQGEWMVPILATLLEDPYAAVRYLAGNSLRAQPGFEDFEYDYLAPPPSLKQARADALARFERLYPPSERTGGEAVLFDGQGRLKRERIERHLAERDDRIVYRQE